jgi:probable phosphoglycerate mutase
MPWSPAPRRRVYLMRHGEVDYFDGQGQPYRPELVPLNEEGRRQAEAAAAVLAPVRFDRVLCSGLNRALETARLALGGRDLVIEHEPRLREIEVGRFRDWSGATTEQVEAAILGALRGLAPDSRFLGGETFGSLEERVGACWGELLARPDWRQVLIVAHGVVNRLLLCGALGTGLAGLNALEQDAGCINLLELGEAGTALVRLVNYTPAHPAKLGLEMSTLEGLYRQYRAGRP